MYSAEAMRRNRLWPAVGTIQGEGLMNTNRTAVRRLLLAIIILAFSAASFSQIGIGISVRVGPPALPVYAQPICPGPGYLWTPGYWGWNDDGGYYWVPGTWVVAPVGMLWTPGYWGWGGGFYAWHAGYWGPHVGFYGGINYGFGYGGVGFVGGEWRGGGFYYNRYVTNVSATTVTNVYNRSVVMNENHVAFNGGEGGIAARPTAQEEAAEHEQHTPALGGTDPSRTIGQPESPELRVRKSWTPSRRGHREGRRFQQRLRGFSPERGRGISRSADVAERGARILNPRQQGEFKRGIPPLHASGQDWSVDCGRERQPRQPEHISFDAAQAEHCQAKFAQVQPASSQVQSSKRGSSQRTVAIKSGSCD